jgi:beta-glucosidase
LGVAAVGVYGMLGPRGVVASVGSVSSLVEDSCAADGADCQEVHTCCDSSQKCYKKNDYWASCISECDPEAIDPEDNLKWACEVLSDGGVEEEEEAETSLPKCNDVNDPECLKQCSISGGGPDGDCLKTWCCQQPGAQCYQQNKWWASCKPACSPTDDGNDWLCKELGPRTPGDTHTWEPCKSDGKEYPLLAHGDIDKAWDSAEARAAELLETLELEDKLLLLRGQNDPWPNDRHGYAGYINPDFFFRNKCAMPLMLNDGPQGYNHYQKDLAGTTTQFPCLLAVAASFDEDVSRQYAKAIADEFVSKGSNVMLGPDMEVGRNPLSGRSFETLSGEDPYLGSALVAPFVAETLKRGIIVTMKHWLDNNEEDFRQTMNVNVSERAQHEIYMPVFKAAIEAGAGAIMCAYNKVYGTYACENEHLLKKLLRQDLNFRGFVMSDWGATHNAERSAKHGLDMEMPGGSDGYFHQLHHLVKNGTVDEATIDKMASHVLSSMFAAGLFDKQFEFVSTEASLNTNVTSDEHRAVARKTIIDSAVLLKNEGNTLPLTETKGQTIALVGKYCNATLEKSYGQGDVFSGGGSGWVQTNMQISPLEGIQQRFQIAEVTWSETAEGAEGADVVIVCAAGHAEEGWDKADLTLPMAEELVSQVRAQDRLRKIVVLAVIPGVVTTEWVKQADAVLALFMPGEQVGPAVAQLLAGDAAPGGRLPVSLPKVDEERFTPQQYPGLPFNDINMTASWSEGVLVGYRWNDAKKKPSAFPFGFGLTYTTFEFKNFDATCQDGAARVVFDVANTGVMDAAAVPQLYVGFAGLAPVIRQLRGFRKVQVKAGGMSKVNFDLTEEDWRIWDEKKDQWVSAVELGDVVTVSVGSSSADLHWTHQLTCLSPQPVDV